MSQHSSPQPDTWIGRLVGDRYRLDQRLGGGGMGDVFLATDTRLGKAIALKVLKESLAITNNRELETRFERECAICAALKSTHIVQVSDYGLTSENYPFYVMEYLQGQTLGQLLTEQPRLSVEQTCNIMIQVCAGLEAAHAGVVLWNRETNTSEQIKVVHRDLKPDNIFLIPTALGEFVKIIDFGIAKIQSLQAEHTATNLFLGTCHYASPEQFDGDTVDERSDIYSLGVILYEMLSGIDPFGLDFRNHPITNHAWLTAHATKPPQPLRSQSGCEQLPSALEAVVMRCLQKSPTDRFASVSQLKAALQTATTRPTLSSPAEAVTQVRQRLAIPATPVSRSDIKPETALPHYLSKLLIGMGGAVLALTIGLYAVPYVLKYPNLVPRSLAGGNQLALVETLTGTAPVQSALLSPDGRSLVSVDTAQVAGRYPINVWNVGTRQVQRALAGHTDVVQSLSLSADGKLLASGSGDRTIKLWNLTTGELIQTLEGHTAPVLSVALSRDSQTLVSGSEDRTVRIWNLETGESRTLSAHTAVVYSVALSPDGKTIASSSGDKTVRIWNATTGDLLRTLGEPGGHRDAVAAVAFSPDGQQIVSGGWDGFVKLWNASTGQLLQTFEGHSDRVVSVTFLSPQAIASASFDHTIKLWDTQADRSPGKTPRSIQTIPAHSSQVLSVSSLADNTLVSSSSDTTIRIWR
ncbi:serine/threonine protein kinase [Oculatella sp. LEGE 06141]|uniref:serine/threonine-protein kinase n=1 Tax=Oculatella sp. LEGE 06141 TaxID=1828648 RepID=UPI001880B9F0|nr:serine/threonine-protein kinase [Oculatella sp. LEGE 06141]MBE9179994.1 serine/threonine protein kinase [Oculatella sp. LEGE 06141]